MKTAKMSTASKLHATRNYRLFRPNPKQRAYKPRHAEDLAKKMREHGFPQSMAISCYRDMDSKLVLNNGHHRLAAAEMADVAVWYVIEHQWTSKELVDEGNSTRNWSVLAAAQTYAEEGKQDYIQLLTYVKKGIPLRYAGSMLRGEHAASGNAGAAIQSGTFKVKDTKHINTVLMVLEELGETSPEVRSQSFIAALSALLLLEKFDKDQFVQRVSVYPAKIEKRSTRDQMLDQLEEIYNFRSHRENRANLSFEAKTLLQSRKNTFGKTK